MADWQTRLGTLLGLSEDDKVYVEGKLLALGDDAKAARFFKPNDTDEATVKRLRSLLPQAGTSSTPEWAVSLSKKVDNIQDSMNIIHDSVLPVLGATICRTLQSKPGSDSASTALLQKQFKIDLISAYQYPCSSLPPQLKCMVSGLVLDSDIVVAAHLNLKSSEAEGIMLYGIDSVWNPRNGLLWADPIEHAYHANQICIMYNTHSREFVCTVLDKDIMHKPLSDLGRNTKAKSDIQLQGMTFEQCDQRILMNPRGFEPYSRILAVHGALSVQIQKGRQKLRQDMDFSAEDFAVTSVFDRAPIVRNFIEKQLE